MKYVLRTVAFHIVCLLLFGFTYLLFKEHFIRDVNFTIDNKKTPEVLDCFFLSTTIQAGVGYSDLYPMTDIAKIIMMIQQLVMITTNVFLLYFFTL